MTAPIPRTTAGPLRTAMGALLYAACGFFAGLPVYSLVLWAFWGRAPHGFELIALLGTPLLAIAALVHLWSVRGAAFLALSGALPLAGFFLVHGVAGEVELGRGQVFSVLLVILAAAQAVRALQSRPTLGSPALLAISGALAAVALAGASSISLAPQRDVWDSNTRTSMIIYLPLGPGDDHLRFNEAVLQVPSPRGGHNLPAGVIGVSSCVSPPGTIGQCVDFARGASQARATLRARAEQWPTVIAVLEDVAPAAVTREDLGL